MATIRKRNNRWQVQIRRIDAPHLSKSFQRKTEAEAWAREMEVEADRGALRDDPRILQRITLGEILKRYKKEVSKNKAGAQIEAIVLDAFNKEPLAKRSLASIKPSDFATYRDQRLTEVTGSTVIRQLSVIQHAYDIAAQEWGLPIPENPNKRIRKPRNNPPRERRLKSGEYEALLNSAELSRNKLIKPMVILAVETAMRRGEILNTQREHINLTTQQLRIPKTKTGVPRTIPLSSIAVATLATLLDDMNDGNDRVFPMSPNAFRLAWERVKNRTHIVDLHFHDLRHEAVSRLFEKGLGVAHVAAISGHRDFRMLARYTHLNQI
ncbi:tyrosine-type recombinase/integrase [Hyphococcus sp.]|uniref:tyrosine-type recombinase/integrase n=1 Tax=Hyphococcus sp. TaxID=2038636 RepID=UPI00208B00B9|nr:MAG: integrase [Marinicaulis sp.]